MARAFVMKKSSQDIAEVRAVTFCDLATAVLLQLQ
jgi:hypothetical protein